VLRYWLVAGIPSAIAVALAAAPGHTVGVFLEHAAALLLRPRPFVFATLMAIGVCAICVMLSSRVFHRGASTSDELAQLWHARILLTGRFSLPADPNPEFFAIDNVVDRGRWYSHFPIGGPLLLALGMLARAPWIVNPILAGIACAALYSFVRLTATELHARISACLFAASPFILLMSATYMNHTATLCLAMCGLAALAQWERSAGRKATGFAAILGICVGFMAAFRPLDALVFALVVGTFQLTVLRRAPSRATDLLAQAAGGLVGASPLLIANARTAGSPLRFGYDVLYGSANRLGFHVDPYGQQHTLERGLEHATTYIGELNIILFGWPMPVLLFVIAGLMTARRMTRWDILLLALFGAQLIAYLLYWGEGEFLGPRFLFTVTPALIVLVSRTAIGNYRSSYAARVGFLALVAMLAVGYLSPSSYAARGLVRETSRSRLALKADYAGAVREAGVHSAIVFLREPFSARLARRLWGQAVPHAEAARLIETSDACSLLAAILQAEGGSSESGATRTLQVLPFQRGAANVRVSDAGIHINSAANVTDACRGELLADDTILGAPFGPALLLEPIDRDGLLSGDVIYAADLGERNALLETRFAGRAWHRLGLEKRGGAIQAVIQPYR
jgi:hypothetical protein